jgi:hypothetical protein
MVEQWRRRRRSARAASTAVEETDMSGVDGVGGDWWSRERERRRLREFWDGKRNDTRRADIYRFENIRSNFKLEPLLIVLKSVPKRFWFKTIFFQKKIPKNSYCDLTILAKG